jgi:membrane protease YdiL (CAAX protease family)
MLGLIVQLVLSWIIIWTVEKRGLSVLGLKPTTRRITHFFIFFLLTALICSSGFLMKMAIADQHWYLNPQLSAKLFSDGLVWNIKSVLFEEFIFRGVLLYILIKKLGAVKGIIISAIAFGIYHWFSFGVLGNIPAMIFTFFITGVMGLLLAYGYAKTFSLYIPIAIHLGWNFTQIFIFSQGPIGNGIFMTDAEPFKTNSYFTYFAVTFSPMILAIGLNYLLICWQPQDVMKNIKVKRSSAVAENV